MNNLAFIQWMQIADAVAWAVAFVVFLPATIAVFRGSHSFVQFMAPPILFIAINRIWASSAWLIFPQTAFIPNELFLWAAVHAFSIFCACVVILTYRQAIVRERA